MTMVDCCKDCTERTLDCHVDCERYKEAKRKHDKRQAEIKKAKHDNMEYDQFHFRVVSQIKKKANHRKK